MNCPSTVKEKDPKLRHTVLMLIAFHEPERTGLDAFLVRNDGERCLLPEKQRLADLGFGPGDRAKEPQPVPSRPGPRFLFWQPGRIAQPSCEECERRADRLEALLGRPSADAAGNADTPPPGASRPTDLFGNPVMTDHFRNAVEPRRRGRR